MSFENRISVVLTVEQKTKAQDAIKIIHDVFKDQLITLTPQQRREHPKMGDGTEPFVSKALEYAASNPEFTPKFVNADDMKIDFETVSQLNAVYRPLKQLMEQLDDSILLSGSEAYVAALAYYNSVKIGAKMNVPGAKAVYNDLKKRFVKPSNSVTVDSEES